MIQHELENMNLPGLETLTIEEEFAESEDEDSSLESELIHMFTKSKESEMKNKDSKDRMANKKLLKEFIVMYKKNRGRLNKSKKANNEVHTALAKIKRQELYKKRRHSSSQSNQASSVEVLPDPNYSTKMFESVFEA